MYSGYLEIQERKAGAEFLLRVCERDRGREAGLNKGFHHHSLSCTFPDPVCFNYNNQYC